jgi:hypothetical protein
MHIRWEKNRTGDGVYLQHGDGSPVGAHFVVRISNGLLASYGPSIKDERLFGHGEVDEAKAFVEAQYVMRQS